MGGYRLTNYLDSKKLKISNFGGALQREAPSNSWIKVRSLLFLQYAFLSKQRQYLFNAVVQGMPVGVNDQVRMFRGLVGGGYAGEMQNLALPGFFIKSFHIPLFADGDVAFAINF